MNYKGKGNGREQIMEMSHIASKLKALKLEFCLWHAHASSIALTSYTIQLV